MKNYLLLLIVLISFCVCAENVTYVITGRNSVSVTGTEPVGSTSDFFQTSNTGRIGQLTKGNCAVFTITDLPHIIITDITLEMHSNSASGSGELSVFLHDEQIVAISDAPFDSELWYGSYSSADVAVPIAKNEHFLTYNGDSLVVNICATENSLYITSISLTYQKVNSQPYVVTFSTGTRVISPTARESEANAGIILPEWNEYVPDFVFIGWTLVPVLSSDICPDYYGAGEVFYPMSDITLYALYADLASAAYLWPQATDFRTGDYLIADTYRHCIANGGLNSDKKIDSYSIPAWQMTDDSRRAVYQLDYPSQAVYHIDFLPDSMARITNVDYDEVIGFSSSSASRLTNNKDPWNYTIYPDGQICFYHNYSTSSTRYLCAAEGNSIETIDIITFAAQNSKYNGYATLLFLLDDNPSLQHHIYTSYPLTTSLAEYNYNIKITDTQILNPDSRLVQIYSLTGILLISTNSDVSLSRLPSGIHILRSDALTKKIFVR